VSAADHSFEGRVALVTGGGSGIGAATAQLFGRAGARVVVSDLDKGRGEAVVGGINDAGGAAQFLACDVSDQDSVHALFEELAARFNKLDFAYNNAGIPGANAPLAQQEVSTWAAVLGVNLTGVFLCMREELKLMSAQGAGVIVNTASNAGVKGFTNLGPYTASKWGVIGLTKSAALDYGPAGIRINAVCPGATRSALLDGVLARDPSIEAAMISRVPLGRLGEPQDIAEAVIWLCSDAARYVTGTTLLVDGGNTAG
jgi:NAD(P)-dependent dehydrogenase (short-subunit alcohol dehydrogenase family)